MRHSQKVLPLLSLLPWLAAATTTADSHLVGQKITSEDEKRSDSISNNANHIFNSIHDSMRQFGSSLNHNGMGVYIATVPEATELYHGTASPYPVNGTEWLAFEPEHSLIFARPRGGPPGGGPPGEGPPGRGPPGEGPPPTQEMYDSDEEAHQSYSDKPGDDFDGPPPPPFDEAPRGVLGSISRLFGHQQEFMEEDAPSSSKEDEEQKYGYLQTYRTKHALRLIYLDGQSAAKSNKGTLDVQDMVIRNRTDTGRDGGMFGEDARADDLCRIAHEEYNDRVDGILRMEGGFEIILCSFAKHLDLVRITATKPSSDGGKGGRGGGGGPPGHSDEDEFSYYEAVAARYDGIGAGRVSIDYEHFVTMFAYPSLIYFDDTGRPRIRNDSAEIDDARADIKAMVLGASSSNDNETTTTTTLIDWQAVVDQIITRYADRIEYMASGKMTTVEALKTEIELALRPFIDYSARNTTLEAERCAAQFWPSAAVKTPPSSLSVAGWAVRETYHTMCSWLAFAGSDEQVEFEDVFATVSELKRHLAWTTWKRCRGCGVHEICMLPIWPRGSNEDFVQPRCVTPKTFGERRGSYWGGMGGPPPHARPGGPKKGKGKGREKH